MRIGLHRTLFRTSADARTAHRRHALTSPWYSREDHLELSAQIRLEPVFRVDPLLVYAEGRLRSNAVRSLAHASGAMGFIGLAIENLEQVVAIVDGLVEVWSFYSDSILLLMHSADTSSLQGSMGGPFVRIQGTTIILYMRILARYTDVIVTGIQRGTPTG